MSMWVVYVRGTPVPFATRSEAVDCYLRSQIETQDMLTSPCSACSCSGVYVDYAGPGVGGVSVSCNGCGGAGWVRK